MLVSRFSRRRLLSMTGTGLLTAATWPGSLFAAEPSTREIRFAVLNDLHVVDRFCGPFLDRVVQGLRDSSEKIDLCFLAGDLTEHGTASQFEIVRTAFGKWNVPVHAVIGNHDWKTEKDRKPYEQAYPRALNYTFDLGGWQFLGLDCSQGLRARVLAQPATLSWLDDNLPRLDTKRPLVLVTHFPLGPKVPNRVVNADAVLDRFKGHNLRAVYAGHHHGSTQRKVGGITLNTNRCCSRFVNNHDGSKEKGYFICTAKDGVITHRFVEVKVK